MPFNFNLLSFLTMTPIVSVCLFGMNSNWFVSELFFFNSSIEKSNVSYILKHIFNANQNWYPAWKDIKGEKHFDSVQEKLCSSFNHNHFSIQSTRSIWKLLLFLYPINIYCLWSYQLLFILETRVHFCFKTNLFLIPSLIPGNLNLSTTIFLFNYPSLSLFIAIWFIVTCNKWLNIHCNNRNHEVRRKNVLMK